MPRPVNSPAVPEPHGPGCTAVHKEFGVVEVRWTEALGLHYLRLGYAGHGTDFENLRPSRQPTDARTAEALQLVADLVSFAYAEGFHEPGYDAVKVLAEALHLPPPPSASPRYLHAIPETTPNVITAITGAQQ